MFYVRQKISDTAEINIEINDENVYTHCPGCLCEVFVDLADFFRNTDNDLFHTSIYCVRCSDKIRKGEVTERDSE